MTAAPSVASAVPQLSPEALELLGEIDRRARVEFDRKRALREDRETDRDHIVWGDGLDVVDGPIPWVCEGLRIAPGRPPVLVGEGGTAKSMLAQHIALCIMTGNKILRRFPVRQGRVLWVDYEQGLALTKRRFQRMARAESYRLADYRDSIGYIRRPFFLDAVTKTRRLCDLVAGFDLVVVDSARRSAPALKENEAEASRPFDMMSEASEKTGATFLVVDHASTKREVGAGRKSAQRGHSTKLDGCGTLWSLTKEKGRSTLVSCEREQIEGEFPADFAFDVVDVCDPFLHSLTPPTKDDLKWGLAVVERTVESAQEARREAAKDPSPLEVEGKLAMLADRLLELVKAKPGISTAELAATAKLRREDFFGAKGRLERMGKISNRTGKSTRAEWVAT